MRAAGRRSPCSFKSTLRKRHRAVTPAAIFAALGDETRLRLITKMGETGPASIAMLADGFDISRQAISKHLRVMSGAGLARSVRHGRETVWQLEQDGLAEARRCLQIISNDWDDKLRRLRFLVESGS